MSKVVFLDTGVLGYITHPAADKSKAYTLWLTDLISKGVRVCFAEVCDYELRRKLLHIESMKALQKLDDLKGMINFVPIDSGAMLRAAELWATARKKGFAATRDEELDGDVIQAAQAMLFIKPGDELIIASDNVKHLSRFVSAKKFSEITP